MSDLVPTWVDGALRPIDRLERARRCLSGGAVSAFVFTDAQPGAPDAGPRVLLQRRAQGTWLPEGLWANSACTHPRQDETQAQCLCRRLQEELGLSGVYPARIEQINYRADIGDGVTDHDHVELYAAYVPAPIGITANAERIAQTRWIGLYDLAAELRRYPERFTPWIQLCIGAHLETIAAIIDRR